jgi:hypothetical protein
VVWLIAIILVPIFLGCGLVLWHLCLCLQTPTFTAGDWLREREQDYYICRDKKEGG